MSSAGIIIIATIIIYLGAMVGVGVFYGKKGSGNQSHDQFFLGGRALGPVVTAMSAEASDMSSYLLMGLPGLAYIAGLPEVTWTAIGLAAGTYLNFLLVAKRLRYYSQEINAITIPDFFAHRYEDKKHTLSLIAAIVIVVFFVPYTASGFKAIGSLFNSLFGWNYHASMLIGGMIVVVYTIMGGFMAVSTTDLIQSIFMTIALIIIVFFGIKTVGGLDQVIANAKELPGYLTLNQGFNVASGETQTFGAFSVATTLAWGLGYFGMPHILLRFMAIRDAREIAVSRRIASVWVVVSMGIAVFIGVIGYSMSKIGAIDWLLTSSDSETVIVKMAYLMSENGFIFAVAAGIILAGILAATMSTADSQLLAAASAVSHDLMSEVMGIKMNEKKTMVFARGTVVAIALVGMILAWNPNSSVFRVVSFAWAGFGAAFGPVVLLALFWKRSNKAGAVAGMITGAAMVFIWKFVIAGFGGIFAIYELLPAFIIGLVVNVVVSLCTKAPNENIIAIFDNVAKMSRRKNLKGKALTTDEIGVITRK